MNQFKCDPFGPMLKNGGLYARGPADGNSGVVQHAASIRAVDERLPVGINVLFTEKAETASQIESFVAANPDLVPCDRNFYDLFGAAVAWQPVATRSHERLVEIP